MLSSGVRAARGIGDRPALANVEGMHTVIIAASARRQREFLRILLLRSYTGGGFVANFLPR